MRTKVATQLLAPPAPAPTPTPAPAFAKMARYREGRSFPELLAVGQCGEAACRGFCLAEVAGGGGGAVESNPRGASTPGTQRGRERGLF